ncbi:MAG: hypothetical protein ACRD21_13365 [Vicinamibacteria bacterium]
MDGEPRCFPNHFPRAKNLLAGQVHDFEPAAKEGPLLSGREFQELVFEEGVGYQDLVRELQERIEKRDLSEIDKTAAFTDDDPHPSAAL